MRLYLSTVQALRLATGKTFAFFLALALCAFTAQTASAQAITPEYDSFGPQPTMTFGGSGIPNDWVLSNTPQPAESLGFTLALTAHQRYDNPALTNDGAGTFFAQAGIDNHAPSPGDPYSLWNFAWSISGANVASYDYRLYFDFNPAVGNDRSDHGYLYIPAALQSGLFAFGLGENSWNLGMDFLTSLGSPMAAPSFGSFDPEAEGEYTFLLEALYDGEVYSSVGMAVQVGNIPTETVPEPATMTLLATGLAGMAAARKRRKKQ